MGSTASKSITGVAAIGIGIGALYISYLQDVEKEKKIEEEKTGKLMETLKEKFLFKNFGEDVGNYLSICKEEIKKTNDENLLLTIKFFKGYFSIIDIMTHKDIKNLRKIDISNRLNLLKKFDFSGQQKIQKKFVKEKMMKIQEAEKILVDILNLEPEQVMASKIQLIRQKPKKYVEIFLAGPRPRILRAKETAPDYFKKAIEAINFVGKRITSRKERGFNSVDTSIFPSMFEEEITDELLVRYGLNFEQLIGVSVKLMEKEIQEKNEDNRLEEDIKERWQEEEFSLDGWKAFEPKIGPVGEKFLELIENYKEMLCKMYNSMTLFEEGIRIQVDKGVRLSST